MLFFIAIFQLLNSSVAAAKNLGSVVFYEDESAYFYEQNVANSPAVVFYQPKLAATWKQITAIDQGQLWQVNVNFRTDIDFNNVKAEVPAWKGKIFVRASIDAVSDCRFTPDIPGRFKSKLKTSTVGKTFSGLNLCQFEVLTKLDDQDILNKLREKTKAGTLVASGLEDLTLLAVEPDLLVSVDGIYQYLLPYNDRLRELNQTTAQFAMLLAVGGVKGEVLLSLLEKVDPAQVLVLQQKIFVQLGTGFDLRSQVADESLYLGTRTIAKTISL